MGEICFISIADKIYNPFTIIKMSFLHGQKIQLSGLSGREEDVVVFFVSCGPFQKIK